MLRVSVGSTPLRAWPVVLLRWLLMIGVPVTLAIVELQHPAGIAKDVYGGLSPMATTWLRIHLIQFPLFGLMFVAALNLTWGYTGVWAWLSRIALWFFIVFYTALDAIAGLGVGTILTHQSPGISAATVAAIVQQLFNDPVVGGVGSVISLTGSWAWLVAILAAILVLYWNNRTRPLWQTLIPVVLLAVSAYALYTSHTRPYGPIAFSAFAMASIWFEIFRFGPAEPIPPSL